MYCTLTKVGDLQVYTDENDSCFNCKNLTKCPLIQAISKEIVIMHYSDIEVRECGLYKRF